MSKVLRYHFGEPNATALFNELGNPKQMPTETAQEFVIRIMSLRQKVLFVSNEDKCGYNTSLIQGRLRNDNVRSGEFEKWLAIRASVCGVSGVLAWVAC